MCESHVYLATMCKCVKHMLIARAALPGADRDFFGVFSSVLSFDSSESSVFLLNNIYILLYPQVKLATLHYTAVMFLSFSPHPISIAELNRISGRILATM